MTDPSNPTPVPSTVTVGMPDDTWMYVAGGALAVGTIGIGILFYQGARAIAPYAGKYVVQRYVPEYAEHYKGWLGAKTPDEGREHVKRALDRVVERAAAKKPLLDYGASPTPLAVMRQQRYGADLPVIRQWHREPDLHGHDAIWGYVYGKPGVQDGEKITIYPLRIERDVAVTAQSRYRLDPPPPRDRSHDVREHVLPRIPVSDAALTRRLGGNR